MNERPQTSSPHPPVHRSFTFLLLLSVAACTPAGDRREFVTVRDSAGIVIVEHGSLDAARVEAWATAPEPELDIGSVDGPEAYQLFHVSGGARLEDGGVVISNGGTQELRFYDGEGRHVRSVGRSGGGPGEFRFPVHVMRIGGDSLLVHDPPAQRFSVFTTDGRFHRTAMLQPPLLNPDPRGRSEDGSLLYEDRLYDIPSSGFADLEMVLVRYGTDGAVLDTVGRFRAGTIGRLAGLDMVGAPLFEPRTHTTVVGNRIYFGDAHHERIDVYVAGEGLRQVIRWQAGDRTVTRNDIERHRELEIASSSSPDRHRFVNAMVDQNPIASHFAVYMDLRGDAQGNLWVREHERPGYEGDQRWLVFGADGRLRARATLPRGMYLLEIGDEHLLVVERDELHIEHVRLYPLLKSR